MTELEFTLTNSQGLHARPAALFVQKASSYRSKVTVSGRDKTADGKSIMGIMHLGLSQGSLVKVTADGPDEKECLAALQMLLANLEGK